MSQEKLAEFVARTAEELGIPGVAVGLLVNGEEVSAAHGVTSVGTPSPVDGETLFHLASVTKSFTATAVLRLVGQGKVELAAPVRRYVPDLRLVTEEATAGITVLHLLNHTSGLDWNLIDTGEEDDSLPGFVTRMAELPVIAPPGTRASYSQAGYNLLGRVVENVTGLPFERAVRELVLEPVGLTNTFFDLDDVITRKFAVGYNRDEDGTMRAARPWKAWRAGSRGNNPGGGIVSSVSDVLKWARFHVETDDELVRGMRDKTVELRASTLGDGFGICWFLRDIEGLHSIGHGGSGNGQFAELLIVPERNFAVVSLANAGPNGYVFNQAVVRWALENHLGIVERDPEPLPYDGARAREVAGRYEIDAMNVDIATEGTVLTLAVGIKPEIRESSDVEMPPDYVPAAIGFLPDDEYIVLEGGLQGQRGYFSRDTAGAVVGVDLSGRLFTRTS
ncbi:beta-lactamase family protein [Allokutzneria sp. A3M-2-11 16]|uniref:serine hydrolase domain-containing protein n=1 Tax=Allokutzneria sp. A3M-2-11 16 TaxID=2962043 RepID=UPI0020B7C3A9|nr:serine hydrolase domain-containing protein [Allokutzneria sp. A3M-2-11 16]MCP3804011.1 beta-lactamase family protein [Allokutzneria sp. A3M-2-11 16]